MAKAKHLICGVHITERLKHALEVQQVLTEFGGHIKTRLGLHELASAKEGLNGLVIIEFVGTTAQFNKFIQKLDKIVGVDVQQMVFNH